MGSCDLGDTRVRRERKEQGAVVSLVVFPHAEDGVQELAHDGDQGLEFFFAPVEQMVIEGAQMRIVLHGDQGGHIESAAQVAVAGLADARLFVDRAARGVLARIESGGGHPLADIEVGREQGEFGQDGNGTGGADAGGCTT